MEKSSSLGVTKLRLMCWVQPIVTLTFVYVPSRKVYFPLASMKPSNKVDWTLPKANLTWPGAPPPTKKKTSFYTFLKIIFSGFLAYDRFWICNIWFLILNPALFFKNWNYFLSAPNPHNERKLHKCFTYLLYTSTRFHHCFTASQSWIWTNFLLEIAKSYLLVNSVGNFTN